MKQFQKFEINIANKIYKRIICLPSGYDLKKSNIDKIIVKVLIPFEILALEVLTNQLSSK